MAAAYIDLWDRASFDPELIVHLDAHADTLRAYVEEDARIEAEYAANPKQMIRVSNPHWDAYEELRASTEALLRRRVARAWHYTRLTDPEVEAIRAGGVSLSTVDAFAAAFRLWSRRPSSPSARPTPSSPPAPSTATSGPIGWISSA